MKHQRLIHRVWLGPHDPPYPDFSRRWQDLHPSWVVKEWYDADVETLPLILAAEFASAPTYVHQADIVMLEIVARQGGVCAGWDVEPVRNLEPLIGRSDGWCTPDEEGWPGGALFGATPYHAGVLAVLAEIRRRVATDGWHDGYPNLDTGPYAWDAALGDGKAGLLGCDVLGTTRTAYPLASVDRALADDADHMAALRADPEVYAIHRFAGSWIDGGTVRV